MYCSTLHRGIPVANGNTLMTCQNSSNFIAFFDRISVFEAPYRWTSVKGGAHTCFVDAWISNESMKRIWALLLMEVQRYGASKGNNVIEICGGITFNFYMGLVLILIECKQIIVCWSISDWDQDFDWWKLWPFHHSLPKLLISWFTVVKWSALCSWHH